MRLFSTLIPAVLILFVPVALSGCNSKKDEADEHGSDDHSHDHDDHGDEHDHEHDHAEGPHGGHLLELTGGDKDFQAEWLHDDEKGEVTVILLNDDGKTPVENPPAEVTIEITAGNSPKTYTLASTDTVNDVAAEAAYSLVDPTLVTALEIIVDGEEPVLRATIGETPVSATFQPHDHDHDHGHDH